MNHIKKIALSILALSSGIAYAGTMGVVCTAGNVTIPCPHRAWDVGIQALYLKPAYNTDTSYVTSFTNAAGATQWQRLDANWKWGFKLEGSYHFSTGNDLNLNWYHYNNTTTNSIITGTSAAPLTQSIINNPKWDAVNAEFGQMVNFGDFKRIRLHGGAQYAQLSQRITSNTAVFAPEQIYAKFNGFGPRIGADMSYDWGHGFAVYANGATALLVGDNTFNTTTSGGFDTSGSSFGSSTSVIPEIEGKLGAKYTYMLSQGDLSLDVGYMWLNYIQSQTFLTTAGFGGTSDFTLNGPYVGLKWLG